MAIEIRPTGEITIYIPPTEGEVDGLDCEETFDADELQKGPCDQWVQPSYKEDTNTYTVVFSLDTDVGRFEWKVSYSMQHTGIDIDDVEFTKPHNARFESNIGFTTKS